MPIQISAAACAACLDEAAYPLKEPTATSFGRRIAPDVADAMLQLSRHGIRLCRTCERDIRAGREIEVRNRSSLRIVQTVNDNRACSPILAEAELAISLASWAIAPHPAPAYTNGFKLFNAIIGRYPRAILDDGTPASTIERDLGNRVIGVFTIFAGVLVIENLVSRERGKGYASRALDQICAIADIEGCAITGTVQPNSYSGMPIGYEAEILHTWYARCGFEKSPADENSIIRLPRKPILNNEP